MSDDQERSAPPPKSQDQQEPSDLASRSNRSRAPAVRNTGPGTGRELVKERRLPPANRKLPPALRRAAPPVETAPVSWTGVDQPIDFLIRSQRARRRRYVLRLGIFCGLPTVLTLLYMLFVASPRYVSEFEITYQAYQPQQTLSAGLVQSLAGSSSTSSVDLPTIIYEYIRSESLLDKLDSELHLREYYSSPKVDYFSRMNPKANKDVFLRYYLWYVSVSQGWGGYLTIDVQAFDPDYAYAVAKAIVKASDQMVDKMTDRAAQDQVRYAENTLNQAEARVRKARLALMDFQNAHGLLNPPGSANQLGGIVGTLEGNLAAAQTQLATLAVTAPHSPLVAATKAQIAALEEQLSGEKYRLANKLGTAAYSKLLDEYDALQLEQQFAQSAYLAAQQGLAVARADAAQKQIYLVDFAPPYRPDRENIEFAMFYSVTALIVSLVLFGISSLVAGAVRDQSGM
jgi:capsular polysaccharide transport system permease protein